MTMILSEEELNLLRKYRWVILSAVETVYTGGPDGSYNTCHICRSIWAENYYRIPSVEEYNTQVHKDGCEHEKLTAVRNKILGL